MFCQYWPNETEVKHDTHRYVLNQSWKRIQRLTLRGAGFPASRPLEVGMPPCSETTGGFSSAALAGMGKSSRWLEVPFSGSSTNLGEDMISVVAEPLAIVLYDRHSTGRRC